MMDRLRQPHHHLIMIFFIHVTLLSLPSSSQRHDDFVISGYLPEYRSYINVNASSVHLTDLMLFSITPETIISNSEKSGGCCVSADHFDYIRKAREYKMEKQNGVLRLILTVGGAGRSGGFSTILWGDLKMKNKFVNDLVKLW